MDQEGTPFNSYFVRFHHRVADFTANLEISPESFKKADFHRVSDGLYMVFFSAQIRLHCGQEIGFKKKDERLSVLLPVLNKYNQRKLKKIAEFFSKNEAPGFSETLLGILNVDKFIEVRSLFPFYARKEEETVALLLQLEIERKIKIIDFRDLWITSHDHFQAVRDELMAAIREGCDKREKWLTLVDLEKRIKVPHSTLFFNYLLRLAQEEVEFKVDRNRIYFQKLPLTEVEKERMSDIAKVLKKNRFELFSIDQVLKVSGMPYSIVNQVLWNMLQDEQLLQLNDQYFMGMEEYQRMINRLKKYKRNQGETIDFQGLREITGLSRKYLIILFEYLDARQITKREGNARKLLISA